MLIIEIQLYKKAHFLLKLVFLLKKIIYNYKSSLILKSTSSQKVEILCKGIILENFPKSDETINIYIIWN